MGAHESAGEAIMSRLKVSLLFFVCLSGAGQAQTAPHATPPDAFRHFSDSELAKLSSGKGALTLSTLSDHQNYYVLVAGRTGPGEVEVHEHWIDYMAIQQGEAEFTSGGTATGMHDTGPGERRGGSITGGTVVSLKPGDFLMVPAGQPHLTTIKPGSNFRAIVFKVRE
jgi:mannose-6-phosphate isomerase-like protein (cupin superfamily)